MFVFLEQVHRHGVEYLVGEHDTIKAIRQPLQPLDFVKQFRGKLLLQEFPLALAQVSAGFEDQVRLDLAGTREQIAAQSPAAGTEFE